MEQMQVWVKRHITWLVGVAVTGTIIGIAITAALEPSADAAWIAARQLYGLTALGFLLAATLIGPLTAVFPRLPLLGILLSGRRAVGVAACVIAIPHVLCYLAPVLSQRWQALFDPGVFWIIGLGLGLLALIDLLVLTWTSRDAAVAAMGGKRWKRLHRTVYVAVPVVLLHALLVGADFGLATPAKGEADYGALIAFVSLTTAWLVLAWLRSRGVRWPTRPRSTNDSSSSAD